MRRRRMTPERLQQIKLIYKRAMELAPSRRDAYLADACAGDEELRREVDALVQKGEQPESPDAPDSPFKTRPSDASKSSSAKSPSSKSTPKSAPRRRKGGEQTPLEVVPGRTTLGSYRILDKIGA